MPGLYQAFRKCRSLTEQWNQEPPRSKGFYIMLSLLLAVNLLVAEAPPAANAFSAQIVLPTDASRIDRFAATELKRCLKASLGRDIRLSEGKAADVPGTVFFVGSLESGVNHLPGFPPIAPIKLSALQPDGVCLYGDGQKVALVGKGPRGGLCAVYDFLERYVGCHWPEPGREYLPKRSDLKLNIDSTNNPLFTYRGVGLHGAPGAQFFMLVVDWLGKNRMNGLQLFCADYDELRPTALDAILDRGLFLNIGAHSRDYFYPGKRYFPPHPDYFAMLKGKRTVETQLCYSNHGSIPEYAANVVAYLKANPEIKMVGLWPSDGYGFCECEKCKSRQTTDVILDYINDLAKTIHEQVPEAKFEFLSYIHYTTPPETVKPLPYVVPTYCEYWSRNQFHPITDNRAGNATCRRQLEGWVKISHEATLFSYYGDDYIKRFLYNPVPDVIVADLNYYKSIGVSGNFVLLTNAEQWWSQAPHVYAYAKVAWDQRTTLEQLGDDYFQSLYGPAAKPMRLHQEAARALFDETFGHGITGEDTLFGVRIGKFNPANEQSSKKKFDAAVQKMKDQLATARTMTADPYILRRIYVLEQDAELMGLIDAILSEEAGYKVDHDEARKDRVRELIQQVCTNDVIVSEDRLRHILNDLNTHIKAMLGAKEAEEYLKPAPRPSKAK
jgi:hypothetical protein